MFQSRLFVFLKRNVIFKTAQVPPGKTPAVQGYLNSKSDTNKIEEKKKKKKKKQQAKEDSAAVHAGH
jgi:hypothetical protein